MLKNIISTVFFPKENLRQKTISAGVWMTVSRILSKIFLLIKAIILARMLAPKDFGLFGISFAVLTFLQTFSQPGTSDALIQKKGDVSPYLNAAWTIKVMRGIILALILCIAAPSIAKFFREPQINLLIYIIAATLVIGGLGNQGIIYFSKELNFRKLFIYEVSGTITDLFVSILLVFILRSALALAYGYLACITVLTLASYLLHPYRPRFRIDIPKLIELSKFGKWIWLQAILGYFLYDGVSFFIGRVLGAAALGLYQMALKITGIATGEISAVFSNVGFPFYSKLQDNENKLKEAFIKSLKINSIIVFPLCILLFGWSSNIALVILGEKWQNVIPLIKIFAVYGFIASISSIISIFFKSVGKPNVTTKLQILKLIFLALSIYSVSSRFGIVGVSLLIFTINLIVFPIECLLIFKEINLELRVFAKIIIFPLFNSVLLLLAINAISRMSYLNINAFYLIVGVIFSSFIYILLCFISDKFFNYGFWRLTNKDYFLKIFASKGQL